MKLHEMEGFLRGKCLPGDLLVGESNAEYLVRKLNEASTLKADRDAQQKRADALAVENENQRDWINKCSELWDAGCDLDNLLGLIPETPATDAALAAIRSDYMAEGAEIVARKAQVIYQERHKSGDFESAGKYLTTIKFANNIATDIREAK